jgi:hypothetical protein
MKFISCHVHETHNFDVIVVANENVVIVMGINISIFFVQLQLLLYLLFAISDHGKTVWGEFCQLPGRTAISSNGKTWQIYMKPFLTIFYTPNSWQKKYSS